MKKTLFFGLLMGLLIGVLVGCGTTTQKSALASEPEKQHVLSVEDVIKLPAPPGWNRSGAAVYVVNYQPQNGNKETFILTITDAGAGMQQVISH